MTSVAPGLGLGAPSKVSLRLCQAWNNKQAKEAMSSVAPGLGLHAPIKVSHIDFMIFQANRLRKMKIALPFGR